MDTSTDNTKASSIMKIRPRPLATIAAATAGIFLLGACSVESLAERAVNIGLDQAVEGDENIDFDFGGDGEGGFTITTEEGEISLNFDEEGAGLEYDTVDGEGAITLGEDGLVFDTDQGQGAVTFDQETGTVNLQSTEGNAELRVDDNGLTLETDDENFAISNSAEVPQDWPAVVGVPATSVAEENVFTVTRMNSEVIMSANFRHDPSDTFAQDTVDRLSDQGWTIEVSSVQGARLTSNEIDVTVVSAEPQTTIVTITQRS